MSLRPGFRNRFTFHPFCSKRTNNFDSVSPNGLDRKIYKTKFPTLQLQALPPPHPTPPRPFSISHITFTFFFDTQHLVLVTIAMLSRYQSPVTCRSRRVETNFTHKVNYRYYCHFQAWNLYRYPKELEGLPSQWQGDGWILQIAYLLENYIGTVVWHCRYIRGRCSYPRRTKRGKKTRDLWRNSWYYRMYEVTADLSHKSESLWPCSTYY